MKLNVWLNGRIVVAACALFASLSGCASEDVGLVVRRAEGALPSARSRVSVLGVFRSGALSEEAWQDWSPRLGGVLPGGSCEAAWGKALEELDLDLATAVDDATREDGPNDEILGALAPLAGGDSVLLITVSGHARKDLSADTKSLAAVAAPTGMGRGMGRGMGQGMGRGRAMGRGTGRPPSEDALVMTATLYSTGERRTTLRVDMTYTGRSADEATRRFVLELGKAMPDASCASWNWDAPLRAAALRALDEVRGQAH
jgi:hypothetical protein